MTARNWSLPASSETGFRPQEKGRGVLLDCACSRVLAALLGPEERVLQHPARAARQAVGCAACKPNGQPRRCRRANSRRAFQQPRPRWAQGSGPFRQPPQVTKAPPATATSPSSAATAAVFSTACAAPRSTSCARCPASSRRRSTSLSRPMICGGGPDGATHLGGRTQRQAPPPLRL